MNAPFFAKPVKGTVKIYRDLSNSKREYIMKALPKVILLASVIVFVIAIVLSLFQTDLIAGPNGWLDLSLVLAVFSIAIKYIHT